MISSSPATWHVKTLDVEERVDSLQCSPGPGGDETSRASRSKLDML